MDNTGIKKLLLKLESPDNVKKELLISNDLNFNIKGMFDVPLWSPTLQEYRDANKKQPKIEPSENIKEVDNGGKKGFKLEDIEENSPEISRDPELGENSELTPEEKQTQKDFANLIVLIGDMGVNFGISALTKYEVKERESDNSMRRKQLERSCIKIMNHYNFVPNMWTELLTVFSAYGLQKYNSLELKQEKKKVERRGRKTKKVDPEKQNDILNENINKIQGEEKEGIKPEPKKTLPSDNMGIIHMITNQAN